MNQQNYLSKSKIAELADVSIGRCKYAMTHFAEYFPEHKIDGKAHTVYESESVDIVRLITSMIGKYDHTQIRQSLIEADFSPVVDMVDKSIAKATNKSVTANQLLLSNNRDLHTALETMDALRQLNEHQRQVIDDQKRVIDDLKRQLDDD